MQRPTSCEEAKSLINSDTQDRPPFPSTPKPANSGAGACQLHATRVPRSCLRALPDMSSVCVPGGCRLQPSRPVTAHKPLPSAWLTVTLPPRQQTWERSAHVGLSTAGETPERPRGLQASPSSSHRLSSGLLLPVFQVPTEIRSRSLLTAKLSLGWSISLGGAHCTGRRQFGLGTPQRSQHTDLSCASCEAAAGAGGRGTWPCPAPGGCSPDRGFWTS